MRALDQVVAVKREELMTVEEQKEKNTKMETQLLTKQPQTGEGNMEDFSKKSQNLEERLQSLEKQMSNMSPARPAKAEKNAEHPSQKDEELQKQNLKLVSDTELCLQLEHATVDLPRVSKKVTYLEESCKALKSGSAHLQTRLSHMSGARPEAVEWRTRSMN
ncbi:centrosomal protein of 290 kDa-like [Nerophis ophidion]|uniref:centrosomal protein of 290 kDa-like n=1 Tax=Nerophis ophidion TaxID=159077 RepID=UPI002ADF395C|nr:centrosomal protein of 290 kDa-like [Nerophis ophidion]